MGNDIRPDEQDRRGIIVPSEEDLQLEYLQGLAKEIYDSSYVIHGLDVEKAISGFCVVVKCKYTQDEFIMGYGETVTFLRGLNLGANALVR